MAPQTVFYAWQSDLPNPINRGFIETCLNDAIKKIHADTTLTLEPCLDRDTSGVPGMPSIADTIFTKIAKASVFVGDVSFIDQPPYARRMPNPNVLVELGFAASQLGWARVVCVINEASGPIEELPFDLKGRRLLKYSLNQGEQKASVKKQLSAGLAAAIKEILSTPNAEYSELLAGLDAILVDVVLLENVIDEGIMAESFGELIHRFQVFGSELRELSSQIPARTYALSEDMLELADSLDAPSNPRLRQAHRLPSLKQAITSANEFRSRLASKTPQPDIKDLNARLASNEDALRRLAHDRAQQMANDGRIEDLQIEAARCGEKVLRLAYAGVERLRPLLNDNLRRIGSDLYLLGRGRYLGPNRISELVKRIQDDSAAFSEMVASLNQ